MRNEKRTSEANASDLKRFYTHSQSSWLVGNAMQTLHNFAGAIAPNSDAKQSIESTQHTVQSLVALEKRN